MLPTYREVAAKVAVEVAAEVAAEAAVVIVRFIAYGRPIKGREAYFLLFSYIRVRKAVNKSKKKY